MASMGLHGLCLSMWDHKYLGVEGVHDHGHALALGGLFQLAAEDSDLCLIPHNQGALVQDLVALGMDLDLQGTLDVTTSPRGSVKLVAASRVVHSVPHWEGSLALLSTFCQAPTNTLLRARMQAWQVMSACGVQAAGWPTFLARVANFRVLCVSSAWLEAGVMVATTDTRAPLPVMLLCSSRVSLESRKGMCTALPSDSLPMTVPSVSRLLLMKLPSRA